MATVQEIRSLWLCINKYAFECRECGRIRACTVGALLESPACEGCLNG